MSITMIIAGIVLFYFLSSIKIINEYERAVIFRLGRVLDQPKGPGIIFVFAPIDRAVTVSLQVVTLDVPPQDIITKDNISAKINAVTYFRVVDPTKAVIEVQNYQFAISQMAQTTLRSVIGECELDDLLSQREKINAMLQTILDKQSDPWGIKVTNVEVKHVDLSDELRRAMAAQAEAERERRAKIIAAEGEYQAAEKIVAAAKMMEQTPIALQLRYLQTMVEIGGETNAKTLIPIPLDFFKLITDKK